MRHCSAPIGSNWKIAWLQKGASLGEETLLMLTALLKNVWNYRVNLLHIPTFLPNSFPFPSSPTHLQKKPTKPPYWGFTESGGIKTALRYSQSLFKKLSCHIQIDTMLKMRLLWVVEWDWDFLHREGELEACYLTRLLQIGNLGWGVDLLSFCWSLSSPTISCLSGWPQAEPWWTSS